MIHAIILIIIGALVISLLPGIFKNKTLSLIFKILGFVIVVAGIIDCLRLWAYFNDGFIS